MEVASPDSTEVQRTLNRTGWRTCSMFFKNWWGFAQPDPCYQRTHERAVATGHVVAGVLFFLAVERSVFQHCWDNHIRAFMGRAALGLQVTVTAVDRHSSLKVQRWSQCLCAGPVYMCVLAYGSESLSQLHQHSGEETGATHSLSRSLCVVVFQSLYHSLSLPLIPSLVVCFSFTTFLCLTLSLSLSLCLSFSLSPSSISSISSRDPSNINYVNTEIPQITPPKIIKFLLPRQQAYYWTNISVFFKSHSYRIIFQWDQSILRWTSFYKKMKTKHCC